jgi:hypothetical protein
MSRISLRSTVGVAAAVMLLTALTACGQGPEQPPVPSESAVSPTPTVAADPQELLELATRNMLEADSKRLTAVATVSGSTQDAEVVYAGDAAKGHKVERMGGFESVTDFVKIDGSLYILAGEAYWQWHVGLEDMYLVVNHWVRVPADHPEHSALLVLTDQSSPWKPVGELTRDDAAGGADSIVLVDSAGNRFTVSTGDTPFLLRVEITEDTELGPATVDITLSDFGEVTETFTAPTGDIVDLQ